MRRMGNVTGALSFLTWVVHALVQEPIGRWIDRTGTYSQVMFLAGLMPFFGLLAVLLLWNSPRHAGQSDKGEEEMNNVGMRSVTTSWSRP